MFPSQQVYVSYRDVVSSYFQCPKCSSVVKNKSINQHQAQNCNQIRGDNLNRINGLVKLLNGLSKQNTKSFSQTMIQGWEKQIQQKSLQKKKIQEQFLKKVQNQAEQKHEQIDCCLSKNGQICAICYERLFVKDMQQSLCSNGHYFHEACKQKMKNYYMKTCPVCRQKIDHKLRQIPKQPNNNVWNSNWLSQAAQAVNRSRAARSGQQR